VREAREEFAVDVVGTVFVLLEEVHGGGDGAGVGLVDDALDEWEGEVVQCVEVFSDGSVIEGFRE
jgi:hypothetical protein